MQEEQEVAQKYTAKIVAGNRGKISEEELRKLLDDHALSMQALRDRQKDEKAKMNDILEYKKRERLLKRRAQKQDEENGEGSSAGQTDTRSHMDAQTDARLQSDAQTDTGRPK